MHVCTSLFTSSCGVPSACTCFHECVCEKVIYVTTIKSPFPTHIPNAYDITVKQAVEICLAKGTQESGAIMNEKKSSEKKVFLSDEYQSTETQKNIISFRKLKC